MIVERQTPSIFPIISFVVTGGATRRPCTTTPTTTSARGSAASRTCRYVTVQGGDIREIVVEVEPERLVAAGLSLAEVADRLGKEHPAQAVGAWTAGGCSTRCWPTPRPASPSDLEDLVVAEPQRAADPAARRGARGVGHADRTGAASPTGRRRWR